MTRELERFPISLQRRNVGIPNCSKKQEYRGIEMKEKLKKKSEKRIESRGKIKKTTY
jgi:hypothetical protein